MQKPPIPGKKTPTPMPTPTPAPIAATPAVVEEIYYDTNEILAPGVPRKRPQPIPVPTPIAATPVAASVTNTPVVQGARVIRILMTIPDKIDPKSALLPSVFAERMLGEFEKDKSVQVDYLQIVQSEAQVQSQAASKGYDYILRTACNGVNAKRITDIPLRREANYKVSARYELQAVAKAEVKASGTAAERQDRNLEQAVHLVVAPLVQEILGHARAKLAALPAPAQPTPAVQASVDTGIRSNDAELRLVVQTTHSTMVKDYAYSPDGKLLASLSSDGVVKLWNTETRIELATLSGFRTVGIAFSPDGQLVAALGKDEIVRLFDVRTGKLIKPLREINRSRPKRGKEEDDTFNRPIPIAFGPSSKTLVTGGETGVRVWDVAERRVLRHMLRDKMVRMATISPDGNWVAAVEEDRFMRIFPTLGTKDEPTHKFHSKVGVVTSLNFSQDSKSLVIGSRYGSVRIFDVASEKELDKTPPVYNSCDGPFSKEPDKGLLTKLIPIGQVVKMISTGCEIGKDVGAIWRRRWSIFYESSIRSASLSPDGSLLAYSYGDNTVHVVERATRKEFYAIKPEWQALNSPIAVVKAIAQAAKSPKEEPAKAQTSAGNATGTAAPAPPAPAGQAPANPAGANASLAQLVLAPFFNELSPVRFSTDGKTINSIRQFKILARWDARTGTSVSSLAVSERDLSAGFPFPVPWGAVPVFSANGDSLLVGSLTKGIKRWDLKTGLTPQQVANGYTTGNHLPLSPDAKLVVQVTPDRSDPKVKDLQKVVITDAVSGVIVKQFPLKALSAEPAFSPDNKYLALKTFENGPLVFDAAWLRIYDLNQATPTLVASKKYVSHFAFSSDSKLLAVRIDKDAKFALVKFEKRDDIQILQVGVPNGDEWQQLAGFKDVKAEDSESGAFASRVVFNTNASLLASTDFNTLKVWDVKTGQVLHTRDLEPIGELSNLIFQPNKNILTFTSYRSLHHWDLSNNGFTTPPLLTDFWGNLAYSQDGQTLALGGAENRVRLFEVKKLDQVKEIGSLIMPSERDWLVMTPEGRLDTSRLEQVKEVHWVLPSEPFQSQPIELFMREYFEPRLLPRLIQGESLPALGDLLARNRALPEVTITKITPETADTLVVTVQVKSTHSRVQFDAQNRQFQSGAFDLRLNRDGQLVGYTDGDLLAGAESATKSYRVRLPHTESKEAVFSAYAFNREHVKSLSVQQVHSLAAPAAPRKGKVYLITMGVNANDNPSYNLQYAANDARQMQAGLGQRLQASGRFAAVIAIPLIAEQTSGGKLEKNATKEALRAVLDRLAWGRTTVPTAFTDGIPNFRQLERATPDDMVIFSFAGHGYADKQGVFYLVPSNLPPGKLENNLQRCISSDELSLWLRNLDVAEMVMVIDACHAEAAVENNNFKPAPMGSRGLGQLAYDKGMRILAATKKAKFALEVDRLGQGLLTYALIADGVMKGSADHDTSDNKIMLAEWLRYGMRRVPELYQDVRSGKRSAINSDLAAANPNQPDIQQPALFDFQWGRNEALLLTIGEKK